MEQFDSIFLLFSFLADNITDRAYAKMLSLSVWRTYCDLTVRHRAQVTIDSLVYE